MLKNGIPIYTVSRILGHSNVAATVDTSATSKRRRSTRRQRRWIGHWVVRQQVGHDHLPCSGLEAPKPSEDSEKAQAIREEIAGRIRERGRLGACALCGTANWVVGKYAAVGASNVPANQTLGGAVFPFITIYCSNCGNTHFINLLQLGYTDKDWPRLRFPD
jgi:hypothetical protein